MTTITALPTPPSRDDPANFKTRADAFLTALPTFATQTNAVASEVNANALSADADAATATTKAAEALASAAAAAASTGVSIWVSGTTYAIGDQRFSPVNFVTYRRKTAGAGTTDPSIDTANWVAVIPPAVGSILYTAAVAGIF
jgi:hypothetical protein